MHPVMAITKSDELVEELWELARLWVKLNRIEHPEYHFYSNSGRLLIEYEGYGMKVFSFDELWEFCK